MKGKAFVVGAGLFTLVLVAGSVSWAEGPIVHSRHRQMKRIVQGVRSGEITDREFMRLNREQWRIRRATKRAWADGRLTPRERRHLSHKLQQASKHVYLAKHNNVAYYGAKWTYRRPRRHYWRSYHRYHLGRRYSRQGPVVGWSVVWR